jgi:hypothetical protein
MRASRLLSLLASLFLLCGPHVVAQQATDGLPKVLKLKAEGVSRAQRPINVEHTVQVQRNADGTYAGTTTQTQGGGVCGVKNAPTKISVRGETLTISFEREGSRQACGPVTFELRKGKTHLFEGVHPDADSVKVYADPA